MPSNTTATDSLQASFRDAMAHVCSPVAVVTAFDGDRPHGTTVSAFMSLSMEPPMVTIALDQNSELLGVIRAHGNFAVNVLGAHQSDVALAFARKGHDKFDGIGWATTQTLPALNGAAIWMSCAAERFVTGGDHTIIVGAVRHVIREESPPLTYHGRIFGTHSPILNAT
ncbi:flavin reductase family protein [Gordonia rubripertincta]|uniref:Oxidoreductase n=2 Tax=Gordonia rubripertincta TaxID=36822 RepID=A0ABQ0HP79_GORRU|nr:flavin reductase family protein [Gordonia rubripertincta]NKY61641.1 flavin reductase family protein [Gordonia rubripertincta]GAB84042.1 putative oxidoreductase [Gordonia rubripertincta NBRC 101908]